MDGEREGLSKLSLKYESLHILHADTHLLSSQGAAPVLVAFFAPPRRVLRGYWAKCLAGAQTAVPLNFARNHSTSLCSYIFDTPRLWRKVETSTSFGKTNPGLLCRTAESATAIGALS